MAETVESLSAYPSGREGIRVKGRKIFFEGLDEPITITDPAWDEMSNVEKSKIVMAIHDIVKPRYGGRAFTQGATLGASDELIAAATNPKAAISGALAGESEASQPYYDRLAQERGKLNIYRQNYPAEAALAEAAGALTTGVITGAATGGGSTATTGTQLARIGQALKTGAKVGAIEGAAAGFLQGEGGITERLQDAGIGAFYGGGIGAGMTPAGAVIAMGGRGVITAAKKLFGGKGGEAVEAELQRLAQATGKSIDEIVADIAEGRIMAENESLRMTVRSLMTQGGQAETLVRDVFEESVEKRARGLSTRQSIKRDEAVAEIEKYLKRDNRLAEQNPIAVEDNFNKKVKASETDDYQKIPDYKTAQVPLDVSYSIIDAVDSFPEIATQLEKFILSRSRGSKIFTKKKTPDGTKYYMTRNLTLEEAEEARRWFRDSARDMTQGNAIKSRFIEYQMGIQEPLFKFSPELGEAAAKANKVRTHRDLHKLGQVIFNKSSDEIDIAIRQARGDEEAMKSLKAGALEAFRKKMEARGNTNFMNILSNPNNREAKIMEMLFTKGEIEEIFPKVEQAAYSQTAASDIVKGPTTEPTRQATQQMGTNVTAADLGQVMAAPVAPMAAAGAAINIGAKLVSQINPSLSEKQRTQIVQILLSENPQIVERALRDQRGMQAFATGVDRIVTGLQAGLRRPTIQQATTEERTNAPRGLLVQ